WTVGVIQDALHPVAERMDRFSYPPFKIPSHDDEGAVTWDVLGLAIHPVGAVARHGGFPRPGSGGRVYPNLIQVAGFYAGDDVVVRHEPRIVEVRVEARIVILTGLVILIIADVIVLKPIVQVWISVNDLRVHDLIVD